MQHVAGKSYAELGIKLPMRDSVVFPAANPVHRTRAESETNPDTTTGDKTSGPRIVTRGNGGYFDALCQNEDRSEIPFQRNAVRVGMYITDGLNRRLLAALGQFLVDNGGTPSHAVNLISDYATPVYPQANSGDKDWDVEAEAQFAAWARNSDYTGRWDLITQQRLCSRCIDMHGDIGAAITLRGGVPKLRLYDTYHIGDVVGMDKYDGAILDSDGVLLGWKVCEGIWPKIVPRDLSANEMILLNDPEMLHQYRGYSPMRRGANGLRDKLDIKAFAKLKEKLSAALPAFIKGGTIEEDVWGDDSAAGGDAPPSDASQSEKKIALARLLGGDIPILDGDLQQFSISQSGTVLTMMDYLAGEFVSGLDLPPAYFLDEKLTGPNVRGVLGKAQKKFNRRKMTIAKLVEFAWVRVMGWKIATGQIRSAPNWWNINFQFPAMATIDLGDTMSNERADVMCGQMSEAKRFNNKGEDFDAEHRSITNELRTKLATAKTLAAEYSNDPKMQEIILPVILARFGLVGEVSTRLVLQDAAQETQNNADKNKEQKK